MTTRLPNTWEMPAEVTSAFGGQVQEQRVLFHSGHLVVVVHEVTVKNREDQPVVFWRKPSGDWESTVSGPALMAWNLIVDNYGKLVQQLRSKLAKANVARDFFKVLSAVRPVEHTVSEMTAVLERACRLVPSDVALERLWMRARAIARKLSLLVLRTEDGRDLDLSQLSEDQADISNQMVVSSQRLNFLIAMLLPMTAFASIFGMNLFSGLEQGSSSLLFWVVVLLSVIMGVVLSFFVGRMPRQLRRESHLEALAQEVEKRSEVLKHKLSTTPTAAPTGRSV